MDSGPAAPGSTKQHDRPMMMTASLQILSGPGLRPDKTLPDDPERSAPSGLCEEIKEDIGELFYPIRNGCLEVFISGRFEGPVNDQCLAKNIISWNKAPISAVLAVVPVIAHGEKLVGRHVDRSEVVMNAAGINILRIGFLQCLPIDKDGMSYHFNLIARHPNKPFYVCNLRAIGVFEDDNVSAPGSLVRENLGPESRIETIYELVYEEMVANKKIGFHRPRWDFERLDDESGGKQSDDGSDYDGFEIFPNG